MSAKLERPFRPYALDVSSGVENRRTKDIEKDKSIYRRSESMNYQLPDEKGFYGKFGGQFVPETLMTAVDRTG